MSGDRCNGDQCEGCHSAAVTSGEYLSIIAFDICLIMPALCRSHAHTSVPVSCGDCHLSAYKETNIFGNLVLLTVVPGHVRLVVGCAWHWPCIGMVAGPGWGFVLLVGGCGVPVWALGTLVGLWGSAADLWLDDWVGVVAACGH